ncbi:MAG: response regulator, partial [Magnetococcales bacterium]|nr:response regulator [Magnetococcales bacterium]
MSDSRPLLLFIDDLPGHLRALGVALRDAFDISVAVSVADALDLLEVERPDMILLDILMPEEDGFAMLRRLKADPRWREIPVIFITARNDPADEVRGLELGAVDYITKPFDVGVVRARIQRHLATHRASLARRAPPPGPGEPTAPAPEEFPALRDAPLLVVDDNTANRLLAQRLLTRMGARVTTAASGQEGLRKAVSGGFRAVLMDLQMPGMDGLEATAAIRRHLDGRALPIIALTAGSREELETPCARAGIDEILCKPIQSDLLYATLSRWLSPAPSGAAPAP